MLKSVTIAQYNKISRDRTIYNKAYYKNPIFTNYIEKITSFAIKEIQKQFKLIISDIAPYTHTFIIISGLSYKHFLNKHIMANSTWKLDP